MKKASNANIANSSNIEYNSNAIKLDTSEYTDVVTAINTDTPNLPNGLNYKSYGDYFYVFDKFDFNSYIFKCKIKIIDNEQIINKIMGEVDNNDGTTRSIDRLLEVSQNGQRIYSFNSVNAKNNRATTKNGRLSSRRIQENQATTKGTTTNIRKGNENNQPRIAGIENSNESSFSIEKNQNTIFQSHKNNIPNINNEINKGGNEDAKQKQSTYNRQKTSRMQERENTRGKSEDARTNELGEAKRQKALSNYQKQQQKKLGKDFKAIIVEREKQSKIKQIVLEGFRETTGLDFYVFETNRKL